MSIYAIGDLHLSFGDGVEKPMDVYGGNWKNYTEKLRKNWLDTIKEQDTVIIAGDISWGLKLSEAVPDFEWIDRLPGKKLIYKGNHDLWWGSITKLNKMYESITFVQNFAVYAEGWYICGTRGWVCPGDNKFTGEDQKIYDRECLRLKMAIDDAAAQAAEISCDGAMPRIIGVLHYPPTNDKLQQSDFTRQFALAGASRVVYGHLHGSDNYGRGLSGNLNGVEYQLVSMDYLDCMPKLIVK